MDINTLIPWILSLIAGYLGMPITQWLKVKFGLKDTLAYLLSAGIATGLSLFQLFVTNALEITDFTLENFAVVFMVVLPLAQLRYQLLKNGELARWWARMTDGLS